MSVLTEKITFRVREFVPQIKRIGAGQQVGHLLACCACQAEAGTLPSQVSKW